MNALSYSIPGLRFKPYRTVTGFARAPEQPTPDDGR